MSSQQENILRLENISFSYGDRVILRGLDFNFNNSRPYLLTGESGIGKSTLFKVIAGILNLQDGKILLNNKLYSQPSREIFYLPHEQDLFGWMTVHEQFRLCKKIGGDQFLISSLMKEFSLESTYNLYPRELSQGMKKKISLIRAISLRPSVILLDETFGSLDQESKTLYLKIIYRWMDEQGGICIISTHQVEKF